MVADPGESRSFAGIEAHVCLGMATDVGVTGAGERVEDTSVAEVNDGITHDGTLESAAVNELCLGHLIRVIGGVARHT